MSSAATLCTTAIAAIVAMVVSAIFACTVPQMKHPGIDDDYLKPFSLLLAAGGCIAVLVALGFVVHT